MTDQAIELKSVTNPTIERPDPEVPEKAQRRQFSAAYKQRILEEADQLGQIGVLLRREGLYSSHLSTWRSQREHALAAQRRGRKPSAHFGPAERIAELERDNKRLHRQLEQAQAIIEVQKKLSELLVPVASWSGRR
jgi:transposase